MKEFLRQFMDEELGGWLAYAVGHPSKVQFSQSPPDDLPSNKDVYFGPAIRKSKDVKRDEVFYSKYLWVDVDAKQYPQPILIPSLSVFSGHGWHLYWELDKATQNLETLEICNKLLGNLTTGGDEACWNANRVLRVPGTTNTSSPQADVELRKRVGVKYSLGDIQVLSRIDRKAQHRIRTGDRRGYRSRSERDWAVVKALVAYGASDEFIRTIFKNNPVGDKVNDPGTSTSYLERTISEVRKRAHTEVRLGLDIRDDGYYDIRKSGPVRLSTFTLEPKLLLQGRDNDAIVCNVKASGRKWRNVTFTRTAFTSIRSLDKECPKASWQWLGNDHSVRRLLPQLMDELEVQNMPSVSSTSCLGLHQMDGTWYFIGDGSVLSADKYWRGYKGPVAALPTGKERPKLNLDPNLADVDLALLRETIPQLNRDGSIWSLLGWYAAAPFKPWLEEQGYRFPILNVVGTKGSGKTTLIQRVMMPMFGQKEPKSYDAGTTKFVTLALLGGTNAIPIAFSEFRFASVAKFIRYVLLSYDTGHDPRGRADQTTVDYPLSAPFSVDGEDLISDPAAQERIVVCHLKPDDISEGSIAHEQYQRIARTKPFGGFGGAYIQMGLQDLGSMDLLKRLRRASKDIFDAFPMRFPDRIRNNFTVAWFGVLTFCKFASVPVPKPDVLSDSISAVYSFTAQRSRVMVDEFIEFIVNGVDSGTAYGFRTHVEEERVFFQLVPAHGQWLKFQRSTGRAGLESHSIRSQLREVPYIVGPQDVNGTWMYGVNLKEAHELGLDIPSQIGGINVT